MDDRSVLGSETERQELVFMSKVDGGASNKP